MPNVKHQAVRDSLDALVRIVRENGWQQSTRKMPRSRGYSREAGRVHGARNLIKEVTS